MLLEDTFTLPKFTLVVLALRINVAAFTFSTAALLVAMPAVLLTATVKFAPLSEAAVAGVI